MVPCPSICTRGQWLVLSVAVFLSLLVGSVDAVNPIADHVTVSTSKDTESIITLLPNNNGDADVLTCSIETLPTVGDLYELSANYINFGIPPIKGAQITVLPHVIAADALFRVVYDAPSSFVPTRFEYSVTDDEGVPLTSVINGIVDITKSDLITVSDSFHTDASSWTIETAASNAADWSGTSTGSLNHYIYKGQTALVVGQDNNVRWYFLAPAQYYRNNARLYGGTVSFVLGHFEGDLTANQYSNPKSFITLGCSTCGTGGIELAQRSVTYTGGIVSFSFTLDENPSSGWLMDPKDITVTAWSSPTQCQFIQVLSGLDSIKIYGDFTTEHEAIGFDNFAFKVSATPPTIPAACM